MSSWLSQNNGKVRAEKRDPMLFLFRRGPWEPRSPTEDSILYSVSPGEETLRMSGVNSKGKHRFDPQMNPQRQSNTTNHLVRSLRRHLILTEVLFKNSQRRTAGQMASERTRRRGGNGEEGWGSRCWIDQDMGMLTLCSLICERPCHCQGGCISAGSERVFIRGWTTQNSTQVQEYETLHVLYWTFGGFEKWLRVSTMMMVMQSKSAVVG